MEYLRRINNTLQFIEANLDADLSLETIADVAHYSPFHFHRLFKGIVGEPLNAYIIRKRIEKCASVLMYNNEVTVSELSLQYGFTSNSSFTRAFKNFYGVSPTEFKRQNPGRFSKISQEESKIGQVSAVFEKYICNINEHINWITMKANVEIKEIPELYFASITQIGETGIEQAFGRLIEWATPKGLMNKDTKLAMIFHDSFKITAPEKVRFSISMLTPEPIDTQGEIGPVSIKGGKYIVGHFEVPLEDFEKSWSSLFIWMNENGHKKAEGNPFEIYHNDFREHPERKCTVDMYIPVE